MVAGISHDTISITFSMCHVRCNGIPHYYGIYLLAMCYVFLTMWYVFSNHRKLQFSILMVSHSTNTNTKFVWCTGLYSTCWEPSCTKLNLWSPMALLGTQLMEYVSAHQTIIWLSLSNQGQHEMVESIKHSSV